MTKKVKGHIKSDTIVMEIQLSMTRMHPLIARDADRELRYAENKNWTAQVVPPISNGV